MLQTYSHWQRRIDPRTVQKVHARSLARKQVEIMIRYKVQSYGADGAARGRSIKVKVKLKEPAKLLEAQEDQQGDLQQDGRISGAQKKKRRRQ